MNSLCSIWSRYVHHHLKLRTRTKRPKTQRQLLYLEVLEDRIVPTALSVADVAVREGPASLGAIDPAGAASLNLTYPRNIVFDNIPGSAHYHDLFVTSNTPTGNGGEQPPGQVLRFDWTSQTYHSFVSPGSGGLQSTGGITFGPDGNLYVTSRTSQKSLSTMGRRGISSTFL